MALFRAIHQLFFGSSYCEPSANSNSGSDASERTTLLREQRPTDPRTAVGAASGSSPGCTQTSNSTHRNGEYGPTRRTKPHPLPSSPGDRNDLPTFRRGFGWDDSQTEPISPAALYTETAEPLPSPPSSLIHNHLVRDALKAYSDAIKVETPFDVDRLESILTSHPNQPFVRSVLRGLRDGFWPFSDVDWKEDVDAQPEKYRLSDTDLVAVKAFRDREVSARRWSHPIPKLLPGMKTSPMFVVWQKTKSRVITDHAASGLNDSIPKESSYVRYDDMHDFGQALHIAKRKDPSRRLTLWKSDVSTAFLNLPAHPIWQLLQVVEVDGELHIVRRLVFGSRASPRIWCAVSGLLAWVAIKVYHIENVHVYMDDFFGTDDEGNVEFFHGRHRPRAQVQLLRFWDSIGCPYDDAKQLDGAELEIIGFWVNIHANSFFISPEAVAVTVRTIDKFISVPSRSHKLYLWARLAGWLNWVLNVFPWGCPALTEMYRQMRGKRWTASVPLTTQIIEDLTWFRNAIRDSDGPCIRFIEISRWRDADADVVMWARATRNIGLGFVFDNQAFWYKVKESSGPGPNLDIFFYELLAILSAIHHASTLRPPRRHVLIYSSSRECVNAFDSLRVSDSLHNAPLLAVAKLITATGIDVRVRHVERKKNIRAGLMSCLLFKEYNKNYPGDRVQSFSPPRKHLSMRWRGCF